MFDRRCDAFRLEAQDDGSVVDMENELSGSNSMDVSEDAALANQNQMSFRRVIPAHCYPPACCGFLSYSAQPCDGRAKWHV